MNAGLRESLQAVLDRPILDFLPVSGGCISEAWQVRTAEETVFVKLSKGLLPGMLSAEAQGLNELAKSGAIRVPEVIRLTEDFLVLEFIPTAINPPTDFWPKLGQQWELERVFLAKKAVTPMGNGSTAWNPKNNKTTLAQVRDSLASTFGRIINTGFFTTRRSVERKCIGQQQW